MVMNCIHLSFFVAVITLLCFPFCSLSFAPSFVSPLFFFFMTDHMHASSILPFCSTITCIILSFPSILLHFSLAWPF